MIHNPAKKNLPDRLVCMRASWLVLPVVLLLAADTRLRSQEPTIAVDVNVVNVLATVRDKHGQIVNSLNKDDFILTEDGRSQTIRYFSRESNLPLTLGLLVDTSLSQRRVLDQERSASYSFLDKMLQAKDTAFIIHFDREVELLRDLTSSREKLEAALGKLQTPEQPQLVRGGGSGGGQGGPGGWPGGGGRGGHGGGRGGNHGGGTLLYDAIYLASNEMMKLQHGRKALIVLSDGVDHGSKETLDEALEAAQRTDTVVYSILFKDDESNSHWGGGFGYPGGGTGRPGGGHRYPQESHPDGKKVLERISKETGGRLFEVSKKQSIEQIYSQVQEELRNQYSLGYTPEKTNESTGYRKIALATKQKDLAVQARDGYYADR